MDLGKLREVLGGGLAFSLLDRLTGSWTLQGNETEKSWAQEIIFKPLVYTPFLWFFVNLALFAAIALALRRYMARMEMAEERMGMVSSSLPASALNAVGEAETTKTSFV